MADFVLFKSINNRFFFAGSEDFCTHIINNRPNLDLFKRLGKQMEKLGIRARWIIPCNRIRANHEARREKIAKQMYLEEKARDSTLMQIRFIKPPGYLKRNLWNRNQISQREQDRMRHWKSIYLADAGWCERFAQVVQDIPGNAANWDWSPKSLAVRLLLEKDKVRNLKWQSEFLLGKYLKLMCTFKPLVEYYNKQE